VGANEKAQQSRMLGPYLLGPNNEPECGIYTGDARVLAQAIPDESVDLVLLDPPFGIGFDYGDEYEDDQDQYALLLEWIIGECSRVMRPGAHSFVFLAQLRLREVLPLFPCESRIFAACKNFVQMRPTSVQYAYDPVIFWRKDGPRLKKDRGRDWFVANTCITSSRGANEAGWHPCPRPLDTITYMVDCFCPVGGVTVDWFMGSGTTALACRLAGRQWWGCDQSTLYVDLARERVRNTQPPLFVPEPEQLALEAL